jgi:flagellar export protein FliJ
MPPKFTLQSVLNYHHNRVELLEMELGRLRHEAYEVQLQIDYCRGRRQGLFEEARQQQNDLMDMDAVLLVRQQIQALERKLEQHEHAHADLTQQINAQLEKVVVARQDEATLKKLKDKELDAYLAELARREESQRDDIYIAQAFRKAQAAGRWDWGDDRARPA